eukprot:scaffold273405_cov18-Prasinocladus_malaysianus.AAC.1
MSGLVRFKNVCPSHAYALCQSFRMTCILADNTAQWFGGVLHLSQVVVGVRLAGLWLRSP